MDSIDICDVCYEIACECTSFDKDLGRIVNYFRGLTTCPYEMNDAIQAEENIELAKIANSLETKFNLLENKVLSLNKNKKELVEALEFYGDRSNWGAFDFVPNDGESFYQGNDGNKDIFIIQAGKKAREVLGKTKSEQPTEG